MSNSTSPLSAALADRYKILRRLGEGGMATVYLAEDIKHERQVAVKVLRPELAAALGTDRFLREIRIAANLTHPHILPLHDSGEADGFLYYVMPYIEGQTLRDRIEAEGELPVGEAVRIIREVADALAFAHSKGVVHRDIKPDNVMLTGSHAIVADFGVAKAVSEATGRDKLTTAGVALGTPAYMSPEQATADPHIDHRADIYAVGAMAYELLTGRTPFTGATPQSILAAHVTQQPDSVSNLRDQVTAELEAVVMKCLAKKPADRWQAADEMLSYLDTIATTSGGLTPTSTMPLSAVSSRRSRTVTIVAAAAAITVLSLFGYRTVMGNRTLVVTTSNMLQVTNAPGEEWYPLISPDGRSVAYSQYDVQSRVHLLVVRDVEGGNALRPTRDLDGRDQWAVRWSENGQSLIYQISGLGDFYSVPRFGGDRRPVSRADALSSPDGRAVADRDSTGAIRIEGDGVGEPFTQADVQYSWGMRWAPNSRRVAFVNENSAWVSRPGNIGPSKIWVVDLDSRTAFVASDRDHKLNVAPTWLGDSHLAYVSNRDGARSVYLVEVSSTGRVGEPAIVPGTNDAHSVSGSLDGSKIAVSRYHITRNVFSIPLDSTDAVLDRRLWRQETFGNQLIEAFSVLGDTIYFDSHRRGNQDLFRSVLGSRDQVQLTDHPADEFYPAPSPDGTEIAFYSTRTGLRELFVMESAGGEANKVHPDRRFGRWPKWSPDGLRLAYNVANDGGWIVRRDSIGGVWGESRKITDRPCGLGWLPSGDRLVCGSGIINIYDVGGEVLWEWDANRPVLGWADPAGDQLVLVEREDVAQDLFAVTGITPFGQGARTRLATIRSQADNLGNFVASGDRLYFTVRDVESDIWVMDLEWAR